MKFKIDENLPRAFATELGDAGYDAETVRDEALEGASDEIVLGACDREGRILVTEDLARTSLPIRPSDTLASSFCARGSRDSVRSRPSAGS